MGKTTTPSFFRVQQPYMWLLFNFLLFIAFAFVVDTPSNILQGMGRILLSRSLLTTDYIAVGGLGATFVNAAFTGLLGVFVAKSSKAMPSGAIFMGIFLTAGFAFLGKNPLNILPVTLGVYLYARLQREPFRDYALTALLASTLSPVVSELAFMGRMRPMVELAIGCAAGLMAGFVMPVIMAAVPKVHGGYCLYNAGFAGGILAIFIVAVVRAAGLEVRQPVVEASSGNNLPIALFLCPLFLGWAALGLLGKGPGACLGSWRRLVRHSGRLVTDYYLLYGETAFFNMGLCGLLGLTVTLLLGAQLNGPSLSGIFGLMAFGAFGKHLKNCIPVMAGALAGAFFNPPPPTEPSNIVPLLFCTGLAPIAGQYGMVWGAVAGFLHMAIVHYIGPITGGINLYNNGFAGGFVALALVPFIVALKRGKELKGETEI